MLFAHSDTLCRAASTLITVAAGTRAGAAPRARDPGSQPRHRPAAARAENYASPNRTHLYALCAFRHAVPRRKHPDYRRRWHLGRRQAEGSRSRLAAPPPAITKLGVSADVILQFLMPNTRPPRMAWRPRHASRIRTTSLRNDSHFFPLRAPDRDSNDRPFVFEPSALTAWTFETNITKPRLAKGIRRCHLAISHA